ncbi:hypothetical protein [Nitrosomonas sp. Nm166]|uniref:hypothetical protein n=1 Tax=Nitrosomonas sp. Nm166 TaxID=1881054 RepID=UPI0008EFA9A0|nr:hypothetical protein [Nitrosomonas sp. Nm166]SFE19363.1 hypothetical protein SAMN05428977_100915 [Nitrosomonas sp. Nm166]
MKMRKISLLPVLFVLFIISFNAMAACAPQVQTKLTAPPYDMLNAVLTPAKVTSFKNKLSAVKDQSTYHVLLNEAKATATTIANGRIVVTLPDGTVVVDTAKGTANTYDKFDAKIINENHNTRVSILAAQIYDCGIGLESKTSSTTGAKEVYLAKRLGAYLDSAGTVRLSHK